MDRQQRLQDVGVELLELRGHRQLAELVTGAFVERVGDGEAVVVRRQLGDRRDDVEVVVAVVAVELPQLLTVILDAVGVVVVVRLEELVPVAFLGDDDIPQVVRRELAGALEVDAEDAALGPFGDLEDQVDAALRQVDDLRRNGGRDAA